MVLGVRMKGKEKLLVFPSKLLVKGKQSDRSCGSTPGCMAGVAGRDLSSMAMGIS